MKCIWGVTKWFINTNCVFSWCPPGVVRFVGWPWSLGNPDKTLLGHKPVPGRCSPEGTAGLLPWAGSTNFILIDPYTFCKRAPSGLHIFAGQLLTREAPSFQHHCCQNRRKNRGVMLCAGSGEGRSLTPCLVQDVTVKETHGKWIATLPPLLGCFAAGCFTGKALSARSHLHSLGTVVSSEVCQVLGRQWGPACPTDLRTGPCEPFDVLQTLGEVELWWISAVAVFVIAGISQWAFPHSKILWEKILHQHLPLQTPGTHLGRRTTAHTFLVCGRAPWHPPTRSHGESEQGTAPLLPFSHRVLWAIPTCMRSKGMLDHLASVLREKRLIKMTVRSTVFYCSY